MSSAVEVRKVWILDINGEMAFTSDQNVVNSNDGYHLATYNDLYFYAPIDSFKNFVCEVKEGYFVYWQKTVECVLGSDETLGEESFDWGFKQVYFE
ncbi:hypothetical protein [Marinicrinis sediminis]|uniref:Uncharacterized protein n=1 Tax=Marinicrinis sediminis TaxID=1652465 RepID=A0ABW5RC97_9BACL